MLLAALGIVFGAIGLSQGRKKGAATGRAIAGLVLGVLGVLAFLVIVIAIPARGSG